VVAVTVNSAVRAVELLGGGGVTILAADEVLADADVPKTAVGIDGETIMMCTPVRCTIQPPALRVRVPEDRPGSARPSLPSTGRLRGSWPHSAPHRHAPDVRPGGCSLPRPGVSAAVTPCGLRRSPSLSVGRRSSACRMGESCPVLVWSCSAGSPAPGADDPDQGLAGPARCASIGPPMTWSRCRKPVLAELPRIPDATFG
jgi:hypothetical protein